MIQPMDKKNEIYSALIALLLLMIAVIVYQRTMYEDEIGSLRHQIGINEQTIRRLQNDND